MRRVTTKKEGERAAVRDHFPQLLLATYYWRYLTAQQVRRLFSDRYPTATTRTVTHHLSELTQLGLLKTTRPSPNHPNIYSTTAKGRRQLERDFPNQTILTTRDEAVRANQLDHELALSELHTSLHLAIAAHGDLTPLNYQRRYFHQSNRLEYRSDRGLTRVEPDLGILLRINSNGRHYPQLYFIEMDMGTESGTTVYNKLAAYTAWYGEVGQRYLVARYQQLGDPNPQPTFRLLVVTTNRHGRSEATRLATLYQQAQQLPPLIRSRIWFTTQQATSGKQDTDLLTQAIWYPVRQTPTTPRSLFRPG